MIRGVHGAATAGAIVLGLAFTVPAAAQISPGPLSHAHQKLEGNSQCLQCHSPSKGVDRGACLRCHSGLAQRISARQGLHALPDYAACERCHSEHNGAPFELVYWGAAGRSAFDHRQTGYALEGKHAGVACERCHGVERVGATVDANAPRRTFLGLKTACADCHADPHRGQQGAGGCDTCHSPAGWKPATGFDHARTRFPLSGAHAKAACLACHRQPAGAESAKTLVLAQFKGGALPSCVRCHADPHRGKQGADCTACHDTSSFAQARTAGFDHERTAYPLRGRHRAVACARCHSAGRATRIAAFERCETCHVDAHAGQLAKAGGCSTCHGVESFTPSLYGVEQHQKTGFVLRGGHLAVPCVACHRQVESRGLPPEFGRTAAGHSVARFRFAATACRDCHQDPHRGQFDRYAAGGGCAACHGEESWRSVRFDHDRSAFPLRGKHRETDCSRCHARSAERAGAATAGLMLSGLATDCAGCHRDVHAGQLAKGNATACERCHGTDDFHRTAFDHQRDATYQLDGAHVGVPCAACHLTETHGDRTVVRYKPLPHTCDGCHRAESRARGGTAAGR